MINQLEKDRAKKIKAINSGKSYNKKSKRYNDDDDSYDNRGNNGKHKGWTKGKGNQKKNKYRD